MAGSFFSRITALPGRLNQDLHKSTCSSKPARYHFGSCWLSQSICTKLYSEDFGRKISLATSRFEPMTTIIDVEHHCVIPLRYQTLLMQREVIFESSHENYFFISRNSGLKEEISFGIQLNSLDGSQITNFPDALQRKFYLTWPRFEPTTVIQIDANRSALPLRQSSLDKLYQFYPYLKPVQYTNVIVKIVHSQVLSIHLTWVINVHNSGTIKVRIGKAKLHLSHMGKKEHNSATFKLRTDKEEMYLRRSGNTE